MAQAVIVVTKKDTLIKDVNSNMKADPGDSLRYITKIIVSDANAINAMMDTINFDSNLTIDPNYHIGPLARPDSYNCIGNVGINVLAANGLLQNDIDIDMNAPGGLKATMAGATAPDAPIGTEFTTPGGGKVTMNPDGLGAFTYLPSAAYTGLDSFVYQLTDGDPVTPDRTAKVIITVSDIIWFVDNTGGGTGGTGTLSDPFKTINDFNTSSGPDINHNIYLAQTATTYATGIVLKSGQVLIGEGTTGTDLATEFGVTLPPNSHTLPPINNSTAPIIKPTMASDEGITLAMNTTVKGVDVKMGSYRGLYGTGSLGTITISEVFLESNVGEEIVLINATGTMNIDMSGIICTVDDAINIIGGSINVTFTKTTLTHSSGNAIAISGHSGTISYANDGVNSIMQTTSGNGLSISNCAGLYIIENLTVQTGSTGTGIFITNSPAANFAFENINLTSNTGITVNGTGAGAIIVDGSSSITSTNGPALNLIKASSASNNMTFTSVSSSSSTSNGIKLDEFGGSLTMNGGSISGAAGTAYDVGGAGNASGGNAIVTYAGTINNTAGSAVFIRELTGGSHTLSGNITHSGSNIGIQVSEIDNGGTASVAFSGTAKSINSGTMNAVQLLNNPNGTINFTNGGLDIDATSGIGFNATGGGTMNITGVGNSITKTGNGNALNIANTNAGGSGITFAGINVTGGTGTAVNIDMSTGTKSLGDVVVARAGGGTGIFGSNAGTMNSTSGTINSGNAVAIDIDNTILGLTLTSVSCDGPTIGIDVQDCGSTGSITITGTGSTDGSGGTIQNISQHGILVISTDNINLSNMNLMAVATSDGAGTSVFGGDIANYHAGLKLNSASNIVLNNVDIIGSETGAVNGNLSQVGISGQNIAGISLTDCVVENFGNSTNEDNIQFQGLTGIVNLINVRSRDSGGDLFAVDNTGGGSTSPGGSLTMNVSESTFDETVNGVGKGGLRVNVHGSGTTQVSVNTSHFGNGTAALMNGGLQGTALELDVGYGHSGILTVEDNTFIGMNVAVSGSLDVDGFGAPPQLTVIVRDGADANTTGNTIHTVRSNGINLFTNGNLPQGLGSLTSTITDNTIGLDNVPNSGSQLGSGIRAGNEGGSTMTLLIDGNTVQGVGPDDGNGFEGMIISNNVTASNMNATITNNTINDIFDDRGISISQTVVGGTLCADISSNMFSGDIRGDSPFGMNTSVMRVRQTSGNFNLKQKEPTAAIDSDELDDANNIEASNITVSGTINFNQGSCAQPLRSMVESSLASPISARLSQAKSWKQVSDHAREQWMLFPLTTYQIAQLRSSSVRSFVDMPGQLLGKTVATAMYFDTDASGHSWFIDETPHINEEFHLKNGIYIAKEGSNAYGKIDFLTVVMHELGHVIGGGHCTDECLMNEFLMPGIRKFPHDSKNQAKCK